MVSIKIGFSTFSVVILSAIIFFQYVGAVEYRVVETQSGSVRGQLAKTFHKQKPYFEFKGIPYAKPPIGELRFKAPEPIDPWTPKTLDTFQFRNACTQVPNPKEPMATNEDCLYLNVFSPAAISKTAKLAVIVFVHGGSFISGSSQLYGAALIPEQNVILVTINYRLGVFGFLSLGTPEYSGNMGLKDQRLALKWVYNNIEHFGGDKTRITYAGQSAGAVSGLTHIFDSESRTYFKRLIIMSGVMLHSYPIGNHKCIFYEMATKKSIPIKNDTELIEFLRKVPTNDILEFTSQPFFVDEILNFAIWGPIIEERGAIKPIIAEDPYKLLKEDIFRNLSIYFTHTSREFLGFESPSTLKWPAVANAINTLNGVHLPLYAFDLAKIANEPLLTKPYLQPAFNELRRYFFANATNDYEKTLQYLTMKSDLVLNYYMDEFSQSIASKVTAVYYHRFSIDSTLNACKLFLQNLTLPGAAHSDDLSYIFWFYPAQKVYENVIKTKDTDPNSAVSFRSIVYITELFSNFAKYGTPIVGDSPVGGFKPVRRGSLNFLDVTNDGLIVGKTPSGNLGAFVNHFRKEVFRLIESHCDLPKKTEFTFACRELGKLLNSNSNSN